MKDFDKWNEKKKIMQSENVRLYTVREIWWCRFGVNIGVEQDGKNEWFTRPCVIIRGFGPSACLVAPLTTSKRKHQMRVDIGIVDEEQAKVNISQIRVIDTRRLWVKIGFLNKEKFAELRKALKKLF